MRVLTSAEFLKELRQRGAARVKRVSFRRNRSTIWSLTQRGTVLNLHEAYRLSTPELLDAFALIAVEGGVGTPEAEAAGRRVYQWPRLKQAIEETRSEHADRAASACDGSGGLTHCCATDEQRGYLQSLYRYFSATRFSGTLPVNVPIHLSRRMRSALGHMLPGRSGDDERRIVEIALNVDLMLAGNGPERVDTLLHEMAHAADYLLNGHSDHGPSWREQAQQAGCSPETLYHKPVRRRIRRDESVTRVPPLPHALGSRVTLPA